MIHSHIVKNCESLNDISDYFESQNVSEPVAVSILKIAQLAALEIDALKNKIKELENAK